MSKFLGASLPDDLYRRLSGNDLQAFAEKAILICSVDIDGFAHPAMLSYSEVVAKDARNIRFATYDSSTTTRNLRSNGKLTIMILDTRTAYYIKGMAKELSRQMSCSPHNSKFNLGVQEVLADEANEEFEPGAYVMSGVTYKRSTEPLEAKRMPAELLE